ncbi:MAG TPA: ROK family protein [Vicinamibacteria bacterium]|nr:ROK family protein [Vicinamibacteria bacterium]
MQALGIDIGGTGIKVAKVESDTGELIGERVRLKTPTPSTPGRVVEAVAQAVRQLDWKGDRAGCGFPGVVRRGVVFTAANVSKKWIGVRANELLAETTGSRVVVANDADLAGLAEMRVGAGRAQTRGVVLMLTFGTGIGTALFHDGVLVPNCELGHIEIRGRDAETWASERVRVDQGLSFKKWARRVNLYLQRMHAYFWPDLIIFGGGVSKKFDAYAAHLSAPCPIVPAALRNRAGVVGAALAAAEGLEV